MLLLRDLFIAALIMSGIVRSGAAAEIYINGVVRVGVMSWKGIRDYKVVKQKADYSCGAASVAIILNNFYGENLTEDDVLKKIGEHAVASFDDLARVGEGLGYRVKGLAGNIDTLRKLKIPALLYVKYNGDDHFTVFKGLSEKYVSIADPAWGHANLRHDKFLEMWKTRSDDEHYGKLLIFIPRDERAINFEYISPHYMPKIIFDGAAFIQKVR